LTLKKSIALATASTGVLCLIIWPVETIAVVAAVIALTFAFFVAVGLCR
jgi:hypothetical protein